MTLRVDQLRLAAAVLCLLGLAACTQDFWDRSPKVGGQTYPSSWQPPPAPAAAPAPAAPLATPHVGWGHAPAPASDAVAGMPSAEEQTVFASVNRIRTARGLRPLRWEPRLYAAARAHSEEQQCHGYMGHDSPDPNRRTLVQRMHLAGYAGVRYGEVVAWGYRNAQAVVEGWMNSRDHRAILVDGELTEAAFSRVGPYWTGNFGAPRAAATVRAPWSAGGVGCVPQAPRPATRTATPPSRVRQYFPPSAPRVPPPQLLRPPARGG